MFLAQPGENIAPAEYAVVVKKPKKDIGKYHYDDLTITTDHKNISITLTYRTVQCIVTSSKCLRISLVFKIKYTVFTMTLKETCFLSTRSS